jgi:hypothetical protein
MTLHDEFSDHDRVVRRWMQRHGWNADTTFDSDNRNAAGWRYESPGSSLTLRVSRVVLEDTSVEGLIHALEMLDAASRLRREGGSAFVFSDAQRRISVSSGA